MKQKASIFLLPLLFGCLLNGQEASNKPIAHGKSTFLGCAWSLSQSQGFVTYWNQITPENAGKWGSVEGTRNIMRWAHLDSCYEIARKHHMPFKIHTLLWGPQQPGWIGGLDSATQRKEIEEWFSALADRYDTIDYIDVVNEPMNNAPNGMVPWGTTVPNVNYARALGGAGATGWDWVINAFKLARQYFPHSKLILNEYSVINSSQATQKYIQLINLLKADSLIDGIGEQAHAFTTGGVSASVLKSNLDQLAATGIPLYITEMDIDGETDIKQLQEFQRIFPLFWEHPGVKGITLWGFRYGLWRNDQGAFLINSAGKERPAMRWLKAYVNDTLTYADSIVISSFENTDTIFTGDKLLMSAQVWPANSTFHQVTWSVLQSSLASIDDKGMLNAKKAGKLTLKATSWDGSGVSGTYGVVIMDRLVDSLHVSSAGGEDTIPAGETLLMKAEVSPMNAANTTYTWSVVPDNIASINQNGLLIAFTPGVAMVIASANDPSGVSDTFRLTITDRITGTPGLPSETEYLIIPNPVTDGNFTVQGIQNFNKISLFNSGGIKIDEFRNINQNIFQFKSIRSGIYIVRIENKSSVFLKKVIVL